MKKCNKKLFSLLMAFTLLVGLFCGAGTAEAQEARSESARQYTTTRSITYNNASVAKITCTVKFSYGLSTGKAVISSATYGISNVTKGYSVGDVTVTKASGNPAIATYTFTVYKDGTKLKTDSVKVYCYNNGNAS